jgi:uncharacterized phiE125 gp8 family phage protein
MGYTVVTAPSAEPITLAEAKLFLKEDGSDNDALITSMIVAARTVVEGKANRSLVTQTRKLSLDDFPSKEIQIYGSPIQSITHVKYYDSDNVLQTLAATNYQIDITVEPGRFDISSTGEWPDTYDRFNAVEITFVSGYGGASDVPANLKDAMYFMIGHWYENRQDVVVGKIASEIPQSSESLIELEMVKTFV